MKRNNIIFLVNVALLLTMGAAACSTSGSAPLTDQNGGKNNYSSSEPQIATNTTSAQSESGLKYAPAKLEFAVIETDKGNIRIQLFPHKAPKTVENFIKLAKAGFFDGIKWHRVEPGFVIQGGDPLSKDDNPNNDGYGGPGYTIPAEFNDAPHLRGTVAMARGQDDPNSAGSQFYVCLADQPRLDGQYTVFGQVTEGMDVVDKIQKYDIMHKVYIEEK